MGNTCNWINLHIEASLEGGEGITRAVVPWSNSAYVYKRVNTVASLDLQYCTAIGKKETSGSSLVLISPPRPFLISFLLPSWHVVRSYRSHLEERDPIWAMTGRTAPSSDGLLAKVFWGFLGCKANARRSYPLARNPDRSWWHRHTNWKVFLTAAYGSMDN